jgi:hypothetical protein
LPESFFSEDIFATYLSWLNNRHKTDHLRLKEYFWNNKDEFHKAFLFLGEINRYSWHDSFEKLDDYETILFIDQEVNPTYLRLIEAVFFPFVRLIAYFCRLERGKKTEGLDVYNTVEEIITTEFSPFTDVYCHIIRNGIAHGDITYLLGEIQYRDRGKVENRFTSDVVKLVDDLLDVCNSMSLAFKTFMFSHLSDGYTLPQQMLLEELQAETDSPFWHIVGCMPSYFASRNQLIIYARPNTRDYWKAHYATFLSGVLAEFFAPGYDRYFFSLRSKQALPGWAAFDGMKLREAREKDIQTIDGYKGVLEDNLVFYRPKRELRGIFRKLDTLLKIFQIHWPLTLSDIRMNLGHPTILARTSEIHLNGCRSVLNGSVVIVADQEPVSKELIKKTCGRIIRAVFADAVKDHSFFYLMRYLPLGFARILVFRRNYRKRKLNNFELGSDLVATIQVKSISRIQVPDICGSSIEIKGKYRIAWNRSWLNQQEKTTDE